MPRSHALPLRLAIVGLAAVFAASVPAAAAGPDHRAVLEAARRHLEAEDPEAALRALEPLTGGRRPDSEALVLQSEARVLQGDVASAFEDLERALELDPTIRQGWLNLAGLEIAQQNYSRALEALEKARDLDPSAEDNDLNLGAVHVLIGDAATAREHFDRYLVARPRSAEAHYLVAANYALAGWAELAVPALEQAIRLDESLRLRARADDRFLALDSSAAYRELLQRDLYAPPPDHRTAAAAFAASWNRDDPRLLYALLDAMRQADLGWEPTIETSARWAIVRGPLRAKVANQGDGSGVVHLSAPPDRFSPAEWDRLTQAIFRSIWTRLRSAEP